MATFQPFDVIRRSATVTTLGETSLYFFRRDSVLRLLGQSPILSVRLIREFSHRMREFNKHYVEEALAASPVERDREVAAWMKALTPG